MSLAEIDTIVPPPTDGLRHDWSQDEIIALFAQPFNNLLFKAQQTHRRFFDANKVQKSRLLSIKTGGCPEDCKYCPRVLIITRIYLMRS